VYRFNFHVTDASERIEVVVSGAHEKAADYGVAVRLRDPFGSIFDAASPSGNFHSTSDSHFDYLRFDAPPSGQWSVEVTTQPGYPSRQIGHLSVLSWDREAELVLDLAHNVLTAGSPQTARVAFKSTNPIRDPERLDVKVVHPNGGVFGFPVTLNAVSSNDYEVALGSFTQNGHYEVIVVGRSGALSTIDIGESGYFEGSSGSNPPAPEFELVARSGFVVIGGSPPPANAYTGYQEDQ
jgi:hypothetical protein